MNKRFLHHVWRPLRPIKARYLLIVTVLCLLLSVAALRSNNEHMARLRSAVYSADKNNGDVAGALKNLQSYVTAHMNTSLDSGNTAVYPPIQLQYTYERLVQQQTNQVASVNGDLYKLAQAYCQQQDPTDFSGHNRVPCIEQYVEAHGAKLTTIPQNLYQFDFVDPHWSPDLAGWSLLATTLLALLTVLKFSADFWARRRL